MADRISPGSNRFVVWLRVDQFDRQRVHTDSDSSPIRDDTRDSSKSADSGRHIQTEETG